MLQPQKKKFRKEHKGRIKGLDFKKNKLHFGLYGLQATTFGKITARQIESVRRTLANFLRRKGKVWIRIFPDSPITEKPNEVRMGKGKGNVSYWVNKVKPGTILFEITGANELLIKSALSLASTKLSVKTKIVGPAIKIKKGL